jgi:acetyl-CoA C-acetyltransferase
MATRGDEPVIMLTAPAPASERALAKAGMKWKDIDLIEVNEAFASVVLSFEGNRRESRDRQRQRRRDAAPGQSLGATGGAFAGTVGTSLAPRPSTPR